jgi:nucleoside-diphosphate-sugar epimerase
MAEVDNSSRAPILVTGLSGNLGRHLAPELKDYPLVGVDLYGPRVDHPQVEFHALDLSQTDAPSVLESVLREARVRQIVHLAFVLDPARTGALTRERQWEINVRGTAHLLEGVERVNRNQRQVDHLLYLSSVTSYGPHLPGPVTEDYPQQPHTYTYALHKKETEDLLRARLPKLNGLGLTIVRGHIFLGPGVDNFIVTALRGQANPRTRLGRWIRRRGWHLPLLLPRGAQYEGLYQFMHMEDAARVLAWLCRHYQPGALRILNAQGRGQPVTGPELAAAAGVPLWRLPSYRFVEWVYRLVWAIGLSPVPPESFPYFAGSYVMNTERLEHLLGADYPRLVRHTTKEALESIKQR